MVLECFACIAFTYSCTKLVDYPESSVPLVFCILKSCLESISIMPLAQRQSFQFLQRWYFERFRGDFRHSVQLQVFGAVSSRRFFFGTLGQCVEHLERSSGLQSGSPWTLTSHLQAYVIVCFLVFKNLKNRIGVLVAVIQQLQVFENHWMSLWLKFESLERTLGQDTNTFHLQQGSLDVCELYSWLLEFWPIEARRQSSNGAISWDIRFATSNLVGVSSNESSFHNSNAQPEVELEVLQQRGNPKLWSDKSKDATQSWVPRASTKALRCTEGDPTFAFRSATPLWSSIGQLQQNGRLNLVLPRSQRRPKFCAQPLLKQQKLQRALLKNDRTSGIVRMCFYSGSLITLNSTTVLWVRGIKSVEIMAASDEQTTVLGCFTAPPFKSCTSYRWGLARHGINKLVQAASADPTTEFCSTLSVSSSSWSWQKCIEWDHRVSQNSVRSLFWSCTTCNFRFWENDRTSGIVLFLQFHRIEQRHVGARSKIDWNHGSIWWTVIFRTILGFCPQAPLSLRCRCLEKCILCTHDLEPAEAIGIAKLFFRNLNSTETSILRSFTAHPLKVAHGIAALARHGINKLVEAASADPNTEFCSILSVSSPWWFLEKCTKTGMTNESKAGLWNHEGATF